MTKARLEAFSDGVFGVAITLLILDVRPEKGDSTGWEMLAHNQSHILVYLLSFVMLSKKFLAVAGAFAIKHTVLGLNIETHLTIRIMKSLTKTCLALLAALALSAFTAKAQTDASSSTSTSTNKPAATTKAKRGKQYAGKITAVDKDAKKITFALPGGTTHTVEVTSKTKIFKNGQPATLDDATVGEHVSGTYRLDDSENWVASTVRIGLGKKKAAAAASSSTNAPPQ